MNESILLSKGAYGFVFLVKNNNRKILSQDLNNRGNHMDKIVMKISFASSEETHNKQLNASMTISTALKAAGIEIAISTQKALDGEVEIHKNVCKKTIENSLQSLCPQFISSYRQSFEEFVELHPNNEEVNRLIEFFKNYNKKNAIVISIILMEYLENYIRLCDVPQLKINEAKALTLVALLELIVVCGINHGDFNFNNIMINLDDQNYLNGKQGRVVLVDYGLSFNSLVKENDNPMVILEEMMDEKTLFGRMHLKHMFRWVDEFLGFNTSVLHSAKDKKQHKKNMLLFLDYFQSRKEMISRIKHDYV